MEGNWTKKKKRMFPFQRRRSAICPLLRLAAARGIFSAGGAVLPDGVDRSSETFVSNSSAAKDLLSELRSHIEKAGTIPLFLWDLPGSLVG